MILLLESKLLAQQVASVVGVWDGCNGILLQAPSDASAFFLALKLAGKGTNSYCVQGAQFPLDLIKKLGRTLDSCVWFPDETKFALSRLPFPEGRKANQCDSFKFKTRQAEV